MRKNINKALAAIKERFKKDEKRYFTEQDIVADFSSELKKSINKSDIIHQEYPTPFRCDMKVNNCIVKSDDDRNNNGQKYSR